MWVLGLETATPVCAVALWPGAGEAAEIRVPLKNRHAERLAGYIELLMRECELDYATLGGVAVSCGPGSFTGLRIGMAMAKAIATAHGLPIAGVSTPDAIAAQLAPASEKLVVVLPSRRGEVYAAKYRASATGYRRDGEVEAVPVAVFAEWAGSTSHVAGPGVPALMKAVSGDFVTLAPEWWQMSAAPIARLGAERLRAGDGDDLATLEPAYVKGFYTTMKIGSES